MVLAIELPTDVLKSFRKTKKKGYISEYSGTKFINKNWFDMNVENIIDSLNTWHNDRLFELDIPLIKILKELNKTPTIEEIQKLSKMDMDIIK